MWGIFTCPVIQHIPHGNRTPVIQHVPRGKHAPGYHMRPVICARLPYAPCTYPTCARLHPSPHPPHGHIPHMAGSAIVGTRNGRAYVLGYAHTIWTCDASHGVTTAIHETSDKSYRNGYASGDVFNTSARGIYVYTLTRTVTMRCHRYACARYGIRGVMVFVTFPETLRRSVRAVFVTFHHAYPMRKYTPTIRMDHASIPHAYASPMQTGSADEAVRAPHSHRYTAPNPD